ATIRRLLEPRFELIEIVVCVAQAFRLGQTYAVDDAGVIEGVADDRVLLVEQGLKQSAVGVEARRVQDGVLGAQKTAQPLLELLVNALCAADETHGRHAVAVTVERQSRRFAHGRMIGESEIVVRAEIDDLLSAGHPNDGLLRRGEHPLRLVEPLGAQFFGLLAQSFQKRLLHGVLSRWKVGVASPRAPDSAGACAPLCWVCRSRCRWRSRSSVCLERMGTARPSSQTCSANAVTSRGSPLHRTRSAVNPGSIRPRRSPRPKILAGSAVSARSAASWGKPCAPALPASWRILRALWLSPYCVNAMRTRSEERRVGRVSTAW